MRYLIMGPQGVGKGTQAALLAKHYGIPTISTGDIFRFNLQNKTPLGLEAATYMEKGELVPDELTNRIVEDRLKQDDAEGGWILDGFPRNAAQVEALDTIMQNNGMSLDAVIALDADRDVLLDRMQKRAQIEGRADDTPQAIAERLSIYDSETKPLLDIYRSRSLLVEVDGVGEIDDITADIVSKLDAR
jgi:adenylate kinase